jgi:hypothetical protein
MYDMRQVWFNEVSEGGDVEEVCDSVILFYSDGEGQTDIVLLHGSDRYHKVVSRPCHYCRECLMHGPIVADGTAEGDSPIDLFIGR